MCKKLAEGKTKIIWKDDRPGYVIIENKNDITAGDGEYRHIIQGKGMYNTEITCNCFRLLMERGIPNHYVFQVDNINFFAEEMTMIPIEIVIRRIACGSYLKRCPTITEGTIFEHLVVEFFLKDDERHDPQMVWNQEKKCFVLYDAKQSKEKGCLGSYIGAELNVNVKNLLSDSFITVLSALGQGTFSVVEEAWKKQNVVLVDMKIECGINTNGLIKVADVISNDEWRILPQKDKEVYRKYCREGKITPKTLAEISENYRWVAQQSAKFIH